MKVDLQIIRDFLDSQPVKKAWLFGSFARGEETPESDVDILVTFNDKAKIGMKYIEIITSLERILDRRVDLVEESTLLPWIKPYVENERILIYERSS